jgi:hypothetical protein
VSVLVRWPIPQPRLTIRVNSQIISQPQPPAVVTAQPPPTISQYAGFF